MADPRGTDPHEHLCLHCGRWSTVSPEAMICPKCRRNGPPLHNVAELMGAWGLNTFLEPQGVTEALLDPAWSVRIVPGETPNDLVLELGWTSNDPALVRRLLKKWLEAAGVNEAPAFRKRREGDIEAQIARESFSLADFQHPAGLYRAVAGRVSAMITLFATMADSIIDDPAKPRPPARLGFAVEWLSLFLAAPPVLDPQRLGERYCTRCMHDQTGYYEPMCAYFRDDSERAWGIGVEPWYDLTLAVSEKMSDPEIRARFLAGPEGTIPPVPLEGSAEEFDLIGRVLGHFRPRRCPGFVPVPTFAKSLEEWADGKGSLIDVARAMYDPMLLDAAGTRLPKIMSEAMERRVNVTDIRSRKPGEIALVANRLLNIAEWISATALDTNGVRSTSSVQE